MDAARVLPFTVTVTDEGRLYPVFAVTVAESAVRPETVVGAATVQFCPLVVTA